jgi:hypothetical protein
MHPEDLNKIWFCEDCQSSFFFNSDAEDHQEETGHKKMRKLYQNKSIWVYLFAMLVLTIIHFNFYNFVRN